MNPLQTGALLRKALLSWELAVAAPAGSSVYATTDTLKIAYTRYGDAGYKKQFDTT